MCRNAGTDGWSQIFLGVPLATTTMLSPPIGTQQSPSDLYNHTASVKDIFLCLCVHVCVSAPVCAFCVFRVWEQHGKHISACISAFKCICFSQFCCGLGYIYLSPSGPTVRVGEGGDDNEIMRKECEFKSWKALFTTFQSLNNLTIKHCYKKTKLTGSVSRSIMQPPVQKDPLCL